VKLLKGFGDEMAGFSSNNFFDGDEVVVLAFNNNREGEH